MIYRFNAFELSPEEGELRKHGIQIRLSPQPLQVLAALVERAGAVVSREDLQNRIWGKDQTSVEFDAGLNRCIRQIRAALNDDADTPRYIETVPRKGYRFIATLERTPVEAPVEPPVIVKARRVGPWVATAILSLVAAVGVIGFLHQGARLSTDLNAVPLAAAMGDQFAPAFSPDGRQVVFVWNGEHQDNFDIYLKLIGSSSAPLRLTTNPDIDYSPAWSPDGRWIAFCRGSGTYGGAVMIIPALGGAERKVVGLQALGSPLNRSLSWARDSKSLVVADRLAGESVEGLYLVDVETGARRRITKPAAGKTDMHPAVSPDGRAIAFTRDFGGGVSAVMVIPFAGGAPPRSLPAPVSGTQTGRFYNARPAWTPDGSQIVFASSAGGRQHLWLVPVNGSSGPLELLALGGAEDADLSTQGELAFLRETFDSNIWSMDVRTPRPAMVTSSTTLEQSPAVSNDGTRIAFESNLSGYSEIWTSHADGSNPVQLTFLQNPVTGSPDWSPDGGHLVFDSRAGGEPGIYMIAADGGSPSRVGSGNGFGVVPRWAPDGRSIYYSSDKTGRMEIWDMPAAGGAGRQVTFDGGFAAMPSRDGEFLYYRSSNSIVSSLWELRLRSGERKLVSGSVADRDYAPAPNGVYFFEGAIGDSRPSLYFFDRRVLRRTRIFESDKKPGLGMMLAPDGYTLYFTKRDNAVHDLWLVREFWK
jgi:Tol biopolymer transport system component/DNA-binding winged helix-turn-helix (wHTH) protein